MKFSDYIMEQELSTDSYNIELSGFFAEMEVYGKLLDCYAKQAMIMEYQSGGDISEFSIFQEADTEDADTDTGVSSDKKSNKVKEIVKKVWEALKKAFITLGRMILNLFGKQDYHSLIKMVEKAPDGTVWYLNSYLNDTLPKNIEDCINLYTEFCSEFKGKYDYNRFDVQPYMTKLKNLTRDAGELADAEKEAEDKGEPKFHKFGKTKKARKEVIAFLEKMDSLSKNKIPRVRKVIKELEITKTTEFSSDGTTKEVKYENDEIKYIKTFITEITNYWNLLNKCAIKMTRQCIKYSIKGKYVVEKDGKKTGNKK